MQTAEILKSIREKNNLTQDQIEGRLTPYEENRNTVWRFGKSYSMVKVSKVTGPVAWDSLTLITGNW